MQRLMSDFAEQFDLDYRVRGNRLGDLLEQAIGRLEARELPAWGLPARNDHYETISGRSLDFYYAPHLFPEMEQKLRLAHKLQFYILPREVPDDSPLSLAAVLESYCHLSGDLFGWEMLEDGKFLVWIVDLSGHGLRAGLASAVLKVLVDNLKQRSRIGNLARELNESFAASMRSGVSNLFATGFFLAVAADGAACYTSAGHPPMLLRRSDGRIEELASNSLPIGMFPDLTYTTTRFRLEADDTLLLYSDGLVEAQNEQEEPFGLARVRGELESKDHQPRSLTDTLYRRISDYHDMDKLEDDVTFVAARMNA